VEKIRGSEPDAEDRGYITAALEGVLAHREEIDGLIGKTAKGWTIDRMSLVDLTIIRLAAWEILYADDVPGSVSISEAMELTERFSDPEDKSFVNGILGTILREHEAQE
jgi:N utilization substance protein B